MSTFEPMSEVTLTDITNGSGLFSDERYTVKRAASTALHHLARARVAEEARDLAIVERDEAYRQRDEARSSFLAADLARHQTERDEARKDAASCARQINDACTILGATDSEMLSDAARRVAAARDSTAKPDPYRTVLDEVRAALAVPYGESVVARAKWIMEARAMSHKMQSEREDEIDQLRKQVAELEAAEAEPTQTFRPQISVTLVSGPGLDHTCAQVKVGLIGDPAFLALSGNDYARLALAVTRG